MGGVRRGASRTSGLGEDVAARELAARRSRLATSGLVICPIVSGLFFGALSAVLVLPSGGAGRASEIGALVGGFMLAANAAALCIVQSAARDDVVPDAESSAPERLGARAS